MRLALLAVPSTRHCDAKHAAGSVGSKNHSLAFETKATESVKDDLGHAWRRRAIWESDEVEQSCERPAFLAVVNHHRDKGSIALPRRPLITGHGDVLDTLQLAFDHHLFLLPHPLDLSHDHPPGVHAHRLPIRYHLSHKVTELGLGHHVKRNAVEDQERDQLADNAVSVHTVPLLGLLSHRLHNRLLGPDDHVTMVVLNVLSKLTRLVWLGGRPLIPAGFALVGQLSVGLGLDIKIRVDHTRLLHLHVCRTTCTFRRCLPLFSSRRHLLRRGLHVFQVYVARAAVTREPES